MYTFIGALILLVVGYVIYGRVVERVFQIDPQRPTPALTQTDGIDYVPLPAWRIFLIQFLNIAGLGPIFGAIMGAMFGPAAFLWIVFGSIFGGAVHDYLSGMMSLRRGGVLLPEIIGDELGPVVKTIMRVVALFMLILVGVVFVSGPASLLNLKIPAVPVYWWVIIIFTYYILATLLPVDKLIGNLYPIFGFALLFMAVGIMAMIFVKQPPIPEITSGLASRHAGGLQIFPMMFVSIACGAVSGFHATQSPMMARCMKNEKIARPCFYGAMIAEGIVALIWAAAASSFFGSVEGLQDFCASVDGNKAALVVNKISESWLGVVGSFLAILGVVAAPITTGDTSLRSARLIAADFLHFEQKSFVRRLVISLPIFAACMIILLAVDFDVIWRYFAWGNQTLSVFTLWAITVYLCRKKRCYWISLIPALFMTAVCSAYVVVAPEFFKGDALYGYIAAAVVCAACLAGFIWFAHKQSKLPVSE